MNREAKDIAAQLSTSLGLKPAKIKVLDGYMSTNYKITNIDGAKYVLKVYNDQKELPIIQEEVLFVNEIKDQLSFILTTTLERNGSYIHYNQNGTYARLLNYVEGTFLAEVNHSPALLFDFGRCMAELDIALKDISAPNIRGRKLDWDLRYASKNRSILPFIKEPQRRKIVDYFLDQFEQLALPHLDTLRSQIIHNDLNDWNVLCDGDRIAGFIDFGDVAHTALINEMAIALTYVMMDNELPVAAACEVIKGYTSLLKLTGQEISLLKYLIPARLCTSVCHSAEAKSKSSDTEYILISEKGAWSLLEKWIEWNPIFLEDSFRSAAGYDKHNAGKAKKYNEDSRKKHFSKALGMTYGNPIHMSTAAFQYMYDIDGNAYLDAYNNIPLVGHAHPKVSQAVSRQIRQLNTNTRYHNESLYAYADQLLSHFPNHLNKVFFVNSGTEANDLAQRLADTYTKKNGKIVFELGYHGHSQELIHLSPYKYNGPGGSGRQDHILELPLPKLYKGKYDQAAIYLGEAKQMISDQIKMAQEYASFLFEPISGCGGQVPIAGGYLSELVPYLQRQGIVCICDEVQIGFGRLGRWFWGFEMQEIAPDIVVLGKPMGNGFPIAGVVTTAEIAASFENGMEFFSSFGGNPLSTEAGKAVLEVIKEEGLQNHAMDIGDYFKNVLTDLGSKQPLIGDIRGEGLFLGIEMTNPDGSPGTDVTRYIKNKLKENYILTSSDGRYGETLKIKPPLCFSRKNVDHFCSKLDAILTNYNRK